MWLLNFYTFRAKRKNKKSCCEEQLALFSSIRFMNNILINFLLALCDERRWWSLNSKAFSTPASSATRAWLNFTFSPARPNLLLVRSSSELRQALLILIYVIIFLSLFAPFLFPTNFLVRFDDIQFCWWKIKLSWEGDYVFYFSMLNGRRI